MSVNLAHKTRFVINWTAFDSQALGAIIYARVIDWIRNTLDTKGFIIGCRLGRQKSHKYLFLSTVRSLVSTQPVKNNTLFCETSGEYIINIIFG